MVTDEELRKLARDAVANRRYSGNVAALRAVFNAGLDRAAEIARAQPRPLGTDPFPIGDGPWLADRIAAAIRAQLTEGKTDE